MGATNSRRTLKEEYLKLVEQQKQKYAQAHPSLFSSPRLQDWRAEAFADLTQAQRIVSWASWPGALLSLLSDWDILMDEKWKSSLLWHDYLRTYQLQRSGVGVSTRSTLAIPLPTTTVPNESLSFLDFLKTHLDAVKTNAIAAMIATFSSHFHSFYSLNPAHDDSFELAIDIETDDDVGKVAKEVHLFVAICVDAFIAYYRGVDLTQFVSESLVEIKDLVIDSVFRSPVADVLLKVYQVSGAEKQRKIDENVEKYSYLRCEDFGIQPLFCLDQRKSANGYEKAIVCLKSLTAAKSPMSKLKSIIKSTRLVCECIDDYWENNPDIEKDDLIVNADQILSIYLYIVLKAKIKNLLAHLSVMQEFLRKDVKQSTMGYYLSTIEASLENVAMLSPEFLLQLRQNDT